MSSFTEPLHYESTERFRGGKFKGDELVGGRRLFRTLQGFAYACDRTGKIYHVPAGTTTDLGSIPAFARTFLSPDDPWAQAYVLHDLLYTERLVPRATADLILRDALALPFRVYTEGGRLARARCPVLYRASIYSAVRIGGGGAYLQP